MDKTVRKINLKDSEQYDIMYWKAQTPGDKLNAVQELRETYYIFKNESRKGFQRIYRIIKQK